MINEVPENILPHLLEIANRLWSGHATIMIGAGFSKNAKKGESTSKHFLTWNELGDCFYKKIHGKSPEIKDRCYLNVLKLADEVQAAFGRNTLDQILKTELPDKEYQPSTLHERTLQLPWTDVFTTNYDTLLERTAEKILQQRYETVINKEDLILSTKPRIIKLHGSFPSERPFIITEEDYRKYPQEFAPFVNTVQQSLLENTLCLIGFSGDDPNFLKWIGWIRDNLGKDNSPKIYLIGILSLSIGEKRLLEDRNIIPIDLSECKNIDKNHEKALSFFINFLHEQGKIEENLNWPTNNKIFNFNIKEDINNQISPVINNWKKFRLKYPNWLILPEDGRETLQRYTEYSYSFIYHTKELNSPFDIEFLFELNWRSERCLVPIFNDWITFYENIIDRYNPFPELINIENAITVNAITETKLNWENITVMWTEIQLSMLRFYREEGINDKWSELAERFSKIKHCLSPELGSRYYYERCLYYLFSLDIISIKRELNQWPSDDSLPYWEAKRAGLLAELGEVLEAEKILESSLKYVRSILNLSPTINDYSVVSQEAYILQLLKHVKHSISYIKNTHQISDSKTYTERWNCLIQYKCDPWGELNKFKLFLQAEIKDFKPTEKKYNFELGTSTITYHFGVPNNDYAQKAYSYLRYIEEIGIPIKLPYVTFGEEVTQKAVSCISSYSPSWALATFIRSGNTKVVESILGRKAISKMSSKNINDLSSTYLSVIEKSINEIKKGDIYQNNNFAISLSVVIPEILSRLCVKCSYNTRIEILIFLKKLYNSESIDKFRNINNLTERLIKSFSSKEQYALIPNLLEFPILDNLSNRANEEFIDPINFIIIDTTEIANYDKIKIDTKHINTLLELSSHSDIKRKVAIIRLVSLHQCNLLTKKQTKIFGENLWNKINKSTGFPEGDYYYYFVYIKLPHPPQINPEQILKEYFKQSPYPIESKDNRISITRGDIELFHNIIGTSNTEIDFIWTEEDLNYLIRNVVEWWNSDKQYLKRAEPHFGGSISDEFRNRFRNMIQIFSYVIFPNIKLVNKDNAYKIESLLEELEEYGMPELEARVSFFELFSKKQKDIISKIQAAIYSKSLSTILDATNAIVTLLEQSKEHSSGLVSHVIEIIKCRPEVGLNLYLDVISNIFRKHQEMINEEILNSLNICLNNLINETKIENDDSDEIVHKKLLYKENSARLTVYINNYFEEKGLDIPEYIIQWKQQCMDPNEFSEFRNIWNSNIHNNQNSKINLAI